MPKRTRINKNPKVRKTQRRGRKQRSSRKQRGGKVYKLSDFAQNLGQAQKLYARGMVPFVYLNGSHSWVPHNKYPMQMSQSSIGDDGTDPNGMSLIHIFYEVDPRQQYNYDSDY